MPEKVLEFAKKSYAEALTKINHLITGKKYAIDDKLTIVDFLFAEMIMNAALINTPFEAEYNHIWTYY